MTSSIVRRTISRLARPGSVARLGLLSTLYFSQGLPYGFFTQALPVMLRKSGYSLGAIGLSSLLALPWALKFVWAPLVDRTGPTRLGRRRAWIVPLQLATAVILALLAIAPSITGSAPSLPLELLLGAVLVVNLLAATQDIATDGLAVDMLTAAERGLANGVQVGAYRVGMIVGGAALLVLFDRTGWPWTFATMALLIVAASIPILRANEDALLTAARDEHVASAHDADTPSMRDDHAASRDALAPTAREASALDDHGTNPFVRPAPASAPGAPSHAWPVHFLRRPGALRVVALLLVYKFGEHLGSGMIRPFLVDRGLDFSDIGALTGTTGFAAGLVGALTGGALANVLGRRRALVVFGVTQALAVGGYAWIASHDASVLALHVAVGVEHFTSGLATVSLFTAMMDWCHPKTTATDYTVMASAVVIATGTAGAVSGFSADALGYPLHFALAACVALAAVPIAAFSFPRHAPGLAPSTGPR
ncbi:MFS transporter [Myxococcota bacterium]|nr:MFS transporter [Myxococcota bacterium]